MGFLFKGLKKESNNAGAKGVRKSSTSSPLKSPVPSNEMGNSGMASGGMGDVLTGVIASLITQGFTPEAAAHAGVYLHGAAADTLAESIAPFGYLASDVMNAIPGEIKKLTEATS